ncbi:C40 family peptidase [Catenuloplanes atrovinosus]|uniref:Cell wall-associated NlpC family hydrolase n=1 Tax=Catenuloplanes atrovinosus TaxID=137266 RepID=A0AAE3YTN1_9ACTN|nr:C40 family peptidase [Catenuloplanes atrovinosus]MDR7278169.1 cell wall-associated NlpC family hydrolase [Catenuloplanes atrovinosus]
MTAHSPVRSPRLRRNPARRSTLLAALVGLCVAAGQLTAVAPASAAPAAKAAAVVALAKSLTGKRYRYGGANPSGFDCSGFTMYVYRKAAGRALPHSANRQQRYGVAVPKSQARPGDLLIFRKGAHGYHAAIYAGGDYMYDAPRPGVRVGKHRIWSRSYVVRRIV